MNLSIFSAIIFSITIASSAIPISENYVSWSSDSNCLDFDDSRDPNAVCEVGRVQKNFLKNILFQYLVLRKHRYLYLKNKNFELQ